MFVGQEPSFSRPLVFAHDMAWFQSKPYGGKWGWHWTMGKMNPSKTDATGQPMIAAHYHPLIGPYDSASPQVLACQALQMKLAGLSGVFIDWYGTQNLYDYQKINRNTKLMMDACDRIHLRYAIVLEDQIASALKSHKVCTPQTFATDSMLYLKSHFFNRRGYLEESGKPVLLIFGPQYFSDQQTRKYFGKDTALITLLSKKGSAIGAFDWPAPQVGDQGSWQKVSDFYNRAAGNTKWIPVIYPRFHDYYQQAGVGSSYGRIHGDGGKTFQKTLDLALHSGANFAQIATWNDWGEGTQIEPSVEEGYKFLTILAKKLRPELWKSMKKESVLKIPARILFDQQKADGLVSNHAKQSILQLLNFAYRDTSEGKYLRALRFINRVENQLKLNGH